ncbi:MAG: DUF4270 domain-containing protein [Bacteroidetes bacterium]|nr:DUF4270 domain-containing protein [Bacteroidota bacterium]
MPVMYGLVTLSSCKDPDEIGLEVQPLSDQLSVIHTDSTSLITRTIKEDSIRSNGVSYQLLGSCYDPVFGRSDASFFSQVLLGLTPTLGASTDVLVPDSLILSFGYAGFYGNDTMTPQVVHVYKILDDMHADTAYYTSTKFNVNDTDLAAGYTFSPKPRTVVSVESAVQSPQLRIPLSLSFASELLSLNGQSEYTGNSNFVQYLKGLYVKTDPQNIPGKGSISYFDLYNNPYSKLSLYYHNVTTGEDSLHYDYYLTGAIKSNYQEHNYFGAATDVGHQLQDSTYNDTLNYIQSMAGVKTKITFPYLSHFIDSGKVLINKAELDITVQAGSGDDYSPPSKLFLVSVDSAGNPNFLIDYFEGASYFGGLYNSSKSTYTFNIARHLQKILDGKITDHGLYLLVSGAVVQANRVVVGSSRNTKYPMKLKVSYTKLH